MFGLAEGDYLYSFRFTTPKVEGDEDGKVWGIVSRPEVNGTSLNQISQLELDLCLDLPNKKKFILYMDNYFSNVSLFKALRDFGIGACGTTRATTSVYPSLHTPDLLDS
jgi:hypothetical protein